MNGSNLILIVAAEVAALLLVLSVFLVIQNRSLRKLVDQLKTKAQSLLKDLKDSKDQTSNQQTEEIQENVNQEDVLGYLDHVESQLQLTYSHHQSLNSNQDIVLDIEPGIPLPHRAAALRYAVLNAEKEALTGVEFGEQPDWRALRSKYDQIFSFYEDLDTSIPDNTAEIEQALKELDNAKNRIKNLEKFKKLYFELEEKWSTTKQAAQTHFEDLESIASQIDESGEMSEAINKYHASYQGVAQIIEGGIDENTALNSTGSSSNNSAEVQRLRAVAADQHVIIEGLQRKLQEATTEEERAQIVEGLQGELQKQMRFVQESETCIQLLEDELNTVNHDLEIMKSKVGKLPEIKSNLLETRKAYDELDIKYSTVVSENRKLKKHIKSADHSANSANTEKGNPAETAKLRSELTDMEARYNELEEKFLDLKLQQ